MEGKSTKEGRGDAVEGRVGEGMAKEIRASGSIASAKSRTMTAEATVLRGDFLTELARTRGEFLTECAKIRGEFGTEVATLRGDLKTDFADLRGYVRAETRVLKWVFGPLVVSLLVWLISEMRAAG